MSEVPPSQFAQYPRLSKDKQKLKLLVDGYQGLSNAFVVNILLSIGLNFLAAQLGSVAVGIGCILVMSAVVFAITLSANKKIGEGLGWSQSGPFIASGLMAINSAFCCGIIGYVVLQTMALNSLKKHGIKVGLFVTKKKLDAQIDAL